jgi:predicted dehydrogenase
VKSRKNLRVALIGLGFGAEFVPIYLHHPDVESLIICDSDEKTLNTIGDRFMVRQRSTDLKQILNSVEVDAVHLVTPIPFHAEQTVAVLKAGKHCACTVPMATTLEDLHAIIAAQRDSGKVYMGMETAVYTRRFLYAKEMAAHAEFGRIQFVRGAHFQDMENWPSYWMGLPPMHYSTHAVSPILALTNTQARAVCCFGSGVMRPELQQQYGNPYPIETAVFELESETALVAEVTRALFHTVRSYVESFCIYGEKASFEWEQVDGEEPIIFRTNSMNVPTAQRSGEIAAERIKVPDRPDLLPQAIARFTTRGVYDDTNIHLSFLQAGGHDGAHPHLVHEFVRSIVEERQPWPNAITVANWNAPGICAHESAMNRGMRIQIPGFET